MYYYYNTSHVVQYVMFVALVEDAGLYIFLHKMSKISIQ